jgi:hypothetical protein
MQHGSIHAITRHPDYANKLGIVTAEWSGLELHLCLPFQVLLGVDSARADAVFFTLTNNRARRREAIASLAKLLLPEESELRDRTDRVLRRVRNAATRRNALTHGVWHFREQEDSGSTMALDRDTGVLRSYSIEIKTLDQIICQISLLRQDVRLLSVDVRNFLSLSSVSP